MVNPFSPESVEALRFLLQQYKEIECRHWKVASRRTSIAEYRLKRFVSGEQVSSVAVLSVLFDHLRAFVFDPENAASPILVVAADQCNLLFGIRKETDQYAELKGLANLLDEEQRILSGKTEGTFLALRRQSEGGYFISHIIIYDSFRDHGLPTCRISRLRRDEAGNPEGDLVIDGVLFSKNRNISIVGYDRDAGDLRTVSLKLVDGTMEKFKGFTSGYEVNGTAFSAKIIIQKLPRHYTYKSLRELTGLVEDKEATISVVRKLFGEDTDLVDRVNALEEQAYMAVSEAV